MTAATEFDLGPIRITGSHVFKDAGTDKYVLELTIGYSCVEVISSPTGRSITVTLDGERLVAQGDRE